MYVLPDSLIGAILTAILKTLGTTSTGLVNIHLFTNNFTPGKNTVLSDFTELTTGEVPGYAVAMANWFAGVPHRLNSGSWESPDSLADPSFACTGSAPPSPQAVYGWYATDTTDAILLGSGTFSTPYTFAQIGDGFTLPGNPTASQTDGQTVAAVFPDLEPN